MPTGKSLFKVRLDSGNGDAIVLSEDLRVVAGESVHLRGAYSDHVGSGRCFVAEEACLPMPAGVDEATRMVSEGMAIAFESATRLYSMLGDRLFDILDAGDEQGLSRGGMSGAEIRTGLENWRVFRQRQGLWALLERMGLQSGATENRLREDVGAATDLNDSLRSDPHRVVLILPEADWATIDAVAGELGIDRKAKSRRHAALVHALRQAADSGNTFLPRGHLEWAAAKLLGYRPERHEWDNSYSELTGRLSFRDDNVYLPEHFEAAMNAADATLKALVEPSVNDPPHHYDIARAALAADDYLLARAHFDALGEVLANRLSLLAAEGFDEQLAFAESFLRVAAACRLDAMVITASRWAAERLRARCPEARIGTAGTSFGINDAGGVCWEAIAAAGPNAVLFIGAENVPLAGFDAVLKHAPEGASIAMLGDPAMDVGYVKGRPFRDLLSVGANDQRLTVHRLSSSHHAAPLTDLLNLIEKDQDVAARNGRFREAVSIIDTKDPADTLARYAKEVMPRLGFDDPLRQLMVLTPRSRIQPPVREYSQKLRQALNPDADTHAVAVGPGALAPGEPVICHIDLQVPMLVPAGTPMEVVHVHGQRGPVAVLIDGRDQAIVTNDGIDALARAYVRPTQKSSWQRAPIVALLVPDDPPLQGGQQVLYTAAAAATEHVVFVGKAEAINRAMKEGLREAHSLFALGLSERLRYMHAAEAGSTEVNHG